ncbi:probable E3 ubiquitin-protein ligase sinah [Adelges cooleyi]|uniref:probable E3 ubiquitin-protein ligase sinah n=1 Tax=Adelges cooleyi TaxID=133065 RepID=UPI00218000CF|nr:probable E3 ubiquitin-protein ligase sinah [Adelges cooleyi]
MKTILNFLLQEYIYFLWDVLILRFNKFQDYVLSFKKRPNISCSSNRDNEFEVTEQSETFIRVNKNAETYDDLNEQLINLFKCPVCLGHITPPIQQCFNGHIICQSCNLMCRFCPICTSRFIAKRNLCMEKVSYLLKYPCKNSQTGCTEKMLIAQKVLHEQDCEFQYYSCFFDNCSWEGKYSDIHIHMTYEHCRSSLFGEEQALEIPTTWNTNGLCKKWFLTTHYEHFGILVNGSPNEMNVQVYYIGNLTKAKTFYFTIKLSNFQAGGVSQELTFSGPTIPYYVGTGKNISLSKNAICLSKEILRCYVNKKKYSLHIDLNIKSNSNSIP